MANITDPEAIAFVNTRLRKRAELLRALTSYLVDDDLKWSGTVSAKIPNDSSPIIDGRQAEGAASITGADVAALIGVMTTIRAALVANGVAPILQKLCVRALADTIVAGS